MDRFSRTVSLIGENAAEKLKNAKVLVFGAGGVGSYAIEAIARAGVGRIDIVDADTVSESNINRQLIALTSTVGMDKVEAERRRIYEINPDADVRALKLFFSPENADEINFSDYDFVIDAIDTISAKLTIAEKCRECGTELVSSMGTGNKLDPTRFRVTDIYETEGCPLARTMRRELRKRGIDKLNVVFSDEEPMKAAQPIPTENGKNPPGSLSYVPAAAGLVMAGYVIRKIAGI